MINLGHNYSGPSQSSSPSLAAPTSADQTEVSYQRRLFIILFFFIYHLFIPQINV